MRTTAAAALVSVALAVTGCSDKIQVSSNQRPMHRAAEVFYQRCSGCHSLEAADAYGSAAAGNFASQDRTNGPNFNVRQVTREDALFAIRNGGFSGAIMPANVVTGEQARRVAAFLARYSGRQRGGDDVFGSGEQVP
jgi:mono/diheme cytochrome c family protein